VVDDAAIDIWAEVQQGLAEAVGHTVAARSTVWREQPSLATTEALTLRLGRGPSDSRSLISSSASVA
jgi:hypothetical protein